MGSEMCIRDSFPPAPRRLPPALPAAGRASAATANELTTGSCCLPRKRKRRRRQEERPARGTPPPAAAQTAAAPLLAWRPSRSTRRRAAAATAASRPGRTPIAARTPMWTICFVRVARPAVERRGERTAKEGEKERSAPRGAEEGSATRTPTSCTWFRAKRRKEESPGRSLPGTPRRSSPRRVVQLRACRPAGRSSA